MSEQLWKGNEANFNATVLAKQFPSVGNQRHGTFINKWPKCSDYTHTPVTVQ